MCKYADVQIFARTLIKEFMNYQDYKSFAHLHICTSAHLFVMIRFAFNNGISTVKLLYKKQAYHLVREGHTR